MIHIPQVRCRCTNVCKLNFNAGAIHFASFIDLRLVKSPCVLAKLLFSFLSPHLSCQIIFLLILSHTAADGSIPLLVGLNPPRSPAF